VDVLAGPTEGLGSTDFSLQFDKYKIVNTKTSE
jgi:hypothetical protein